MKRIICLAVLAFSAVPVFFSEPPVTAIEIKQEPSMKEAYSDTKDAMKKAKEEKEAIKAELKRRLQQREEEKAAKKKAKADAKQVAEDIKAEKFANGKQEIEDIKAERLDVIAKDKAEKAVKKSKTSEQRKEEKKQEKIDKKNAQKESDSVMYAAALKEMEKWDVEKQRMLAELPQTKEEKLQLKANKTIAKAADKDDYRKAVRAEYVKLMESYGFSYGEYVDKNILKKKEIDLIEEYKYYGQLQRELSLKSEEELEALRNELMALKKENDAASATETSSVPATTSSSDRYSDLIRAILSLKDGVEKLSDSIEGN